MRDKIIGYLFLFSIFAAVMSLIYYFEVLDQEPPALPQHQKSDVQTYKNEEYKFEISSIPGSTMEVLRGDQQLDQVEGSTPFSANARTFVYVKLSPDLFPNTNFVEAWVSMIAAKDLTAPECKRSTGLNFKSIDNNIINGVAYTVKTFMGAAAGNTYETETYNTYQSNICYEINTLVHTANIGNYEPGTVLEIDKKTINAKLREIIETVDYL